MTVVPSDELTGGAIGQSQNGAYVYVLLERKSVDARETRSTLRVYSNADLERFHSGRSTITPMPAAEATLASRTNTAAIRMVRFSPDGGSVVFLGVDGDATAQVFNLEIQTSATRQLTNFPEGVYAFDIHRNGSILFLGRLDHKQTRVTAPGHRIEATSLSALMSKKAYFDSYASFWQRPNRSAIQVGDPITRLVPELVKYWIAPSGQQAVMYGPVQEVPAVWESYEPAAGPMLASFKVARSSRERRDWQQYLLLDLISQRVLPLVNSPSGTAIWNFTPPWAAWSDDSRRVIVANSMLPLNDAGVTAPESRGQSYFLDVDVQDQSWEIVGLVPPSDGTESALGRIDNIWGTYDAVQFCRFKRTGGIVITTIRSPVSERVTSKHLDGATTCAQRPTRHPSLVVRQSANVPPKLIVRANDGAEAELLDLNPQFASITIAEVQNFRWHDFDGRAWNGGLILTEEAESSMPRPPLVIQVYEFDPTQFSPNGTHGAAYAAQALVGIGISVLQMSFRDSQALDTPQEAPRIVAGIDSAVTELTKRGLIDPTRVGLVGWSRGGYAVAYALTHPGKHRIGAAVISDAFDGSYVQYVLNGDEAWAGYETVNDGAPYGANFIRWLHRAPGFNVEKVQTPLRLEAIGGLGSILAEWELYAGLRRLNRVVELHSIPAGTHVLSKPQEEYYSRQGTVDWMQRWLLRPSSDLSRVSP